MTDTIVGVNGIAIAYAWRQKGVSYIVSTCRDTKPRKMKFQSNLEDKWGRPMTHAVNQPYICHFLYQYLPLIDEHNKQQQSLLQLEKMKDQRSMVPTTNNTCWSWLLLT